ncbi:MAG TPA: hypothetical protein VGB79_13310 [Allosphingosinicella sp.]|jgi:hypothetical protein
MKLPRALPPLAGRTGAAIRAAYLALLALTLAALAVGGFMSARDYFVTTPNNLAFGLVTGTGSTTAPDPRQVRIYMATSEAARRSGILKDDIVLAVNGTRVPADAGEHVIGRLTGATGGDVAVVVTRSRDGTVRTHRLPRQAGAFSAEIPGTGLNGWQRSALLFGSDHLKLALSLAAAILLYLRRRSDPVALLFGTAFLTFCLMSGSAFWFWHTLRLDNATHVVSILFYSTLLTALSAFPDGRFTSRWTSALALVGGPSVFLLWIAGWQWRLVTNMQLTIYSSAILLASVVALVLRYRRLPVGLERQQIKWAVFGIAGAILIMTAAWLLSVTGVFFVPGQGAPAFIGSILVGTVSWSLIPIGLLVSLLRYRLYDADAAISRSAAYTVLTLLLVAGFAVAKKGLEMAGERYFEGAAGAISGGLAAAAAAMLIAPMHRKVAEWTEQRFQKALIRMRDGLPELVGDLRETARLRELAETVLERIGDGVRATRAALVVDGHAIAERGGAGETPVSLPLRREDGSAFGAILLGPRPDGSLYGKLERQALDEVTGPVARAVRIVREREAAAEAHAAEMAELKARLAALEERLGEVPLAAE